MTVKTIVVNDMMRKGYRHTLAAPTGRDFDPEFAPELTPKEMLRLGVFGRKYMTDCKNEFPVDWFDGAKLSPRGHNPALNYFGVSASQPLSIWRSKGWIAAVDPRGWFRWYCRYFLGRRIPEEDARQIRRWESDAPTCPADRAQLRARRLQVPAVPTPSAVAVGVRQPEAATRCGEAPSRPLCEANPFRTRAGSNATFASRSVSSFAPDGIFLH